MKMKSVVWKFGDNINTDEIIPARYLNTHNPKELAKHCMEDADPTFVQKIKPGDIIIGGSNFGCGSSREHAPIAIKACGISVVIAKTFARIFFRNAINIGLPIVGCPALIGDVSSGDEVEVDLEAGKIKNCASQKEYNFTKYPPFMQGLISAGGLIEWVKNKTE